MTKETQIFNFNGKDLGLIFIGDKPWFVARDVCMFLKLKNTSNAVRSLASDEKGIDKIYTPGGDQKVLIISLPGLFKLISRSSKPEAVEFDRWVRHEVLPSISDTGSYSNPSLSRDDVLVKMAETIRENNKEIKRRLDEHDEKLEDYDRRMRKVENRYELPKSPLEYVEDENISN